MKLRNKTNWREIHSKLDDYLLRPTNKYNIFVNGGLQVIDELQKCFLTNLSVTCHDLPHRLPITAKLDDSISSLSLLGLTVGISIACGIITYTTKTRFNRKLQCYSRGPNGVVPPAPTGCG